jgi:hypothetical protein
VVAKSRCTEGGQMAYEYFVIALQYFSSKLKLGVTIKPLTTPICLPDWWLKAAVPKEDKWFTNTLLSPFGTIKHSLITQGDNKTIN